MRRISHLPREHTEDETRSTAVVRGTLEIISALLALPDTFGFNVEDVERPPTVEYDLVVAFDMVVYGSSGPGGGPGIMVVCYIDPTGPLKSDDDDAARWVCEMQFILRRRDWDKSDL